MNAYSYGWEKLHGAMHSLAGIKSQEDRLVNAVTYHLIHITPEKDLPSGMRDEFQQFMKEINSVSAKGDEGTIHATVASLDEVGTSNAVSKIIGFYDSVCRHMKPF